jgi:hypothetical protein
VLLEDLVHEGADAGGGFGDVDAIVPEGLDLVPRGTLAAGDDGARVAHPPAGRGGDARDEADDGLLGAALLDVLGGLLLGGASNLADEHDALGLVVLDEPLKAVDKVGAVERVATDADAGGLAEAELGGLGDGLVGEGARPRHDADHPGGVDVSGHDADLAFSGLDDSGAVGADEAGLGPVQLVLDLHHVVLRDPFRDAHNEGDLRLDGVADRIGGTEGRDKDHRGVRPGGPNGLGTVVENGKVQVLPTGLRGVDAWTRK